MKQILSFAATALLICATEPLCSQTASITNTAVIHIDNESTHVISVYPNKARYSGNVSTGTFGDGLITDYRFFNNTNLTIGYATGVAGRISAIAYDSGNNYGTDHPDVWTTNDPDSAPANFTNATFSGRDNVSGTITLNRLVSGTVYVLCGGFSYGTDSFTVELTMEGAGQTSLVANATHIPPSTRNTFAVSFDFNNLAQTYDSITFSYDHTASNRSRFMGVILDAEGPPQGTVIVLQ